MVAIGLTDWLLGLVLACPQTARASGWGTLQSRMTGMEVDCFAPRRLGSVVWACLLPLQH